MSPTLLNNIALSKKIDSMIEENPEALDFIAGVLGEISCNKELMNTPMVGDLTLYEALEQAYINDKIELCEITDLCPEDPDNLRVTARGGSIAGELMIDALKVEVFVRNNLRVYAPSFAAGFGVCLVDSIDTLKKAKLVTDDMPDHEKMAVIDGLMMASLQSEIVGGNPFAFDEGREIAINELKYLNELYKQ